MTTYTARIMACLPGDEPVELHRSLTRIHPKTWTFFTRDMGELWEIWTEHRLPDRHCISSRPKFTPHNGSEKLRLHLTAEQKAGL